MSRLITVADYEREIAGIDQLLEMERESAERHGMDTVTRLSIAALERRREDLLEEMSALQTATMPGHELAVMLSGGPVEGHTIEADFLSRVLSSLQHVVTSAVNVYAGTKRHRGRFRERVRQRSTLRFAGSFAGSFGMTLEAIDEQLTLDGAAAVAPAFEALVNVMQEQEPTPALLEALAPLGSRASSHYRSLLRQLAKRGATIDIAWPTIEGVRRAEVTASQAARLLESLENVDEREIGQTLEGVLGGAIRRTGYFELELDNGEVMSGSISPDILQDHREYFLRRCKAFVVTTTVTNTSTGDTKTHHRLLELEDPDSDSTTDAESGDEHRR